MVLTGVVIFVVVALAYIWGSRGFFSSLIHMVCVLVAGAIAFAFWEPLAYMMLGEAGNNQTMINISWGVCLGVPFAVSLAILRLGIDKLIPANCDLDGLANLLGGICCGAVSGTITAGIFVISASFLSLAPNFGMLEVIKQQPNGAPVIQSKLLYPADRLTAWLYGYASEATLRTATPLAVWRPDVTVDGALLRTNFNSGGSRHTLAPRAFSLVNRFTVAKKGDPVKVSDLMRDGYSAAGKLESTDLHDQQIAGNSTGYYIEAFVVNFTSAAREKEGAVVIGNTQVELVCRNAEDTKSISILPVAVSSKAEPTDAEDKRIRYGRWRYERPNTYIRTVGGTEAALMGFEFLVPRGYTPLALYVKGVREDITKVSEGPDYPDVRARDKAIGDGTALKGEPGVPPLLVYEDIKGGAVVIDPTEGNDAERDVRITNTIPAAKNAVTVLSKDGIGGLKLNENLIIGGEQRYRLSELKANRVTDQKLQVRQFDPGQDTAIVQVEFGKESKLGPVVNGATRSATGAPFLVDSRNERYPCIGFVYFDNQIAHFRFTPESPIGSVGELPDGGASASRPDQRYVLLFRVGRASKLTEMRIGETKIAEFKPDLVIR